MEQNKAKILADFQSRTGILNIRRSIRHLEASCWNLVDAINSVKPKQSQTLPSETEPEILMDDIEASIPSAARAHRRKVQEVPPSVPVIVLDDDSPVHTKRVHKEVLPVIVVNDEEKSVQTPLYLDDHSGFHGLSEDLSKLLDGGSYPYDLKLKCGDVTFGAHRSILSARSPVFAKMLQSDVLQCQTNLVDIQDMDGRIFRHFLRYLYTGRLPELTVDSAKSFYQAGDKCAISELMRRCSSFLTESLTPDNACHLLLLAEVHSDSQFKESVISYIVNKKSPLQSHQWQVFCDEHPYLANEVLNRVCKHLPKK